MSSGVDNRGDPFFIRLSCCCGDGPFLLLPLDVFFEVLELVLLKGGAGVLGDEGDDMVVVVVVLLLVVVVIVVVVIVLVDCIVAWVTAVVGIDGVVDVVGEVDPSSSGGSSSVVSSCFSDADVE